MHITRKKPVLKFKYAAIQGLDRGRSDTKLTCNALKEVSCRLASVLIRSRLKDHEEADSSDGFRTFTFKNGLLQEVISRDLRCLTNLMSIVEPHADIINDLRWLGWLKVEKLLALLHALSQSTLIRFDIFEYQAGLSMLIRVSRSIKHDTANF